MDKVDREILELLRNNSRIPYTEMAKSLSVSEGTIRQRVRRLLKTGAIKRFTIETVNVWPEALILVSTSSSFSTPKIAEQILIVQGVKSISELAGQYDISVVVVGENISKMNHTVDAIRRIKGVKSTHTLFVLKRWK